MLDRLAGGVAIVKAVLVDRLEAAIEPLLPVIHVSSPSGGHGGVNDPAVLIGFFDVGSRGHCQEMPLGDGGFWMRHDLLDHNLPNRIDRGRARWQTSEDPQSEGSFPCGQTLGRRC